MQKLDDTVTRNKSEQVHKRSPLIKDTNTSFWYNKTSSEKHMSSSTEVFDPDFKYMYNVPNEHVVHMPPARLNITRLVRCRNYRAHEPTSCTMGDSCKFIHADCNFDELESHSIHVNYIWRHEDLCTYPRLPPGDVLEVLQPNGQPPSNLIPSSCVLITRGAQLQLKQHTMNVAAKPSSSTGDVESQGKLSDWGMGSTLLASHCPKFFCNRMCVRGEGCLFIHALFIDPSAKSLFKRAPARYLVQQSHGSLHRSEAVTAGSAIALWPPVYPYVQPSSNFDGVSQSNSEPKPNFQVSKDPYFSGNRDKGEEKSFLENDNVSNLDLTQAMDGFDKTCPDLEGSGLSDGGVHRQGDGSDVTNGNDHGYLHSLHEMETRDADAFQQDDLHVDLPTADPIDTLDLSLHSVLGGHSAEATRAVETPMLEPPSAEAGLSTPPTSQANQPPTQLSPSPARPSRVTQERGKAGQPAFQPQRSSVGASRVRRDVQERNGAVLTGDPPAYEEYQPSPKGGMSRDGFILPTVLSCDGSLSGGGFAKTGPAAKRSYHREQQATPPFAVAATPKTTAANRPTSVAPPLEMSLSLNSSARLQTVPTIGLQGSAYGLTGVAASQSKGEKLKGVSGGNLFRTKNLFVSLNAPDGCLLSTTSLCSQSRHYRNDPYHLKSCIPF